MISRDTETEALSLALAMSELDGAGFVTVYTFILDRKINYEITGDCHDRERSPVAQFYKGTRCLFWNVKPERKAA